MRETFSFEAPRPSPSQVCGNLTNSISGQSPEGPNADASHMTRFQSNLHRALRGHHRRGHADHRTAETTNRTEHCECRETNFRALEQASKCGYVTLTTLPRMIDWQSIVSIHKKDCLGFISLETPKHVDPHQRLINRHTNAT